MHENYEKVLELKYIFALFTTHYAILHLFIRYAQTIYKHMNCTGYKDNQNICKQKLGLYFVTYVLHKIRCYSRTLWDTSITDMKIT